jgi:hypothetical protein
VNKHSHVRADFIILDRQAPSDGITGKEREVAIVREFARDARVIDAVCVVGVPKIVISF